MPLYEYRCRSCENLFEYMQGISERPKRRCEECGGSLEKLVSRAGFVLKGTGWYETDFKGGKSRHGGAKKSGDSGTKSKPEAAEKPSKKAASGGD
jgi:putative FmdB family regulatory protein